MKLQSYWHFLAIIILFSSCHKNQKNFDATGSFEAIERTISSQSNGVIQSLNIEEGKTVSKGDTLGKIDVSKLAIQAEQVKANMQSINAQITSSEPQISVLEAQLGAQQGQIAVLNQQMESLLVEINRFSQLVKDQAAPQKQLDDLTAKKKALQKQIDAAQIQKDILNTQMKATKENTRIHNRAVLSQQSPAQKQLELIQSQMNDAWIISDYTGTITNQLVYDGEFTAQGRPLYTIADLQYLILRAYITNNQLAQVKLDDTVTVRTDDGNGGFNESTGKVIWISDKAEFTPKTIQTKDERANLVYAIKIKVENPGMLKIGMYGEIIFDKNE